MARVHSAPTPSASEGSAGNRSTIGESLMAQAYHESIVARLALRALHGLDTDSLVSEAISMMTEAIDCARVHVLELAIDGTPRLRGGVGPTRGMADRAACALAEESLPADARTTLVDGAQGPCAFVLRGRSGTVGILDIQPRRGGLNLEESHFLQSVAAVLGGALERERDIAALRASEERFRLLVDGVRDHALILLEKDGRIATWNPGAERIRGWVGDEIVGRHFSCFYCPSDQAGRPAADLAVAAAQGRFETECWQVRRDGGRFFASASISVLRDDRQRLVGFAHVTRDISARERADRERKLLAEAGAALAESLDYEATLNRVAQLAVPTFADWCLVDLVAEDGSDRVAVAHGDPDQAGWVKSVTEQYAFDSGGHRSATSVIRTGRAVLVSEVSDELLKSVARNPEQLGLLRGIAVRSYICVPLLARGRPLGAITFIAAEPSRRYDDSDLAFAEELGRRCAVAVDNARLYEQAQEAIRDRNHFFSIASHELRTPLAALQLYLQSLIRVVANDSRDPNLLARLVSKAGTAVRQVSRMTKLVDNVLDATQIERGVLQLEPEDFDAVELIREVIERFAATALEASCELTAQTPEAVPVHWDRLRIEQVVTNLISNALKFSPGRPIEVALTATESRAQIRITDHGGGIDPAEVSRIFRPFARVTTAQASPPGLGLGLYISRRIVEGHGGSIVAESHPTEGTTFTVDLPRVAVPQPPTPPRTSNPQTEPLRSEGGNGATRGTH
jgi:PAS domain S-box-containing protein